MNETTDGTGAGMIFFENDFVSPLFLCDQGNYLWKRRIIYALYLVLLEKVSQVASPESIFSGPFVIVNLGLPTILARMIDEGINPRDVDRLYFWGWVMFAIILLWDCGSDYLVFTRLAN